MDKSGTPPSNSEQYNLFSLLPTPVMIIDTDFNIQFLNKVLLDMLDTAIDDVAEKKCYEILRTDKCRTDECPCKQAMEKGILVKGETISEGLGSRIIRFYGSPLKNDKNQIVGCVESLFDITEEEQLKKKIIQAAQEILEVANPIVPLFDGVLALPVVGTLDSQRTQRIMESLLQTIVDSQSKVVIIDITGVPVVDTLVATHLLKTANAVRLLGASAIITGISPTIAQTLVTLGIDLAELTTRARLVDGVALALKMLNRQIVNSDQE